MYSYGSPHMAAQKQDDQLERTFSSYVRIQVVVLKTNLGRWTIGRSGERGSGISVLPARYDDDDDILYTLGHIVNWVQIELYWIIFIPDSNDTKIPKMRTNITEWNDKIVALEKTTWFHFRLMKTGFLF